MTKEEYIEHEVKLRVHGALFEHIDYKFDRLEKGVNDIKKAGYWILGSLMMGVILPLCLHYYKII